MTNLILCRGCQRNLSLDFKGPNLSLTFRARLSTAPIFGISVDSPQRCSPFWPLICFFIHMPSSWESWRTCKQQKYTGVCGKNIYPTATQQLSLRSTDPHRQKWHRCHIYGQAMEPYLQPRPTTCGYTHDPLAHPHAAPTLFPPVYWSWLNSDPLSAVLCPSTPPQKPEARFLLLSWAKPRCCPPDRSSSAALASF